MTTRPAKSWLSVASIALLLSGCSAATFKTRCPPLVSYSRDFQSRAADALAKAPAEVAELVADYSKMRDACRVISR